MNSILILTVGTGTAGKHSDVAAGLANSIRKIAPRLFWLVPSASPQSTPVADLIRETVADLRAFQPWSDTEHYHAIPDPDDIHKARRVLREVIAQAKTHLRHGEKLIVNPTGGTKQMSAAAALAALDEEIGEIMYTAGPRQDGVVVTGSEELKRFSTEDFFLERDFRIAQNLFDHGAFSAAAQILQPYQHRPQTLHAYKTALCLHEWQRLNYKEAASHAAQFSEQVCRHLRHLAQADPFSPGVLGDLLAGADELLRWGDAEEALARYYRGAEQSAKVRLADAHGIRPPYRLDTLAAILPPSSRLVSSLRQNARNNEIALGNQRAWEVLEALQDPMAQDYFADSHLQNGLRRRNESMYGHGVESVDETHARAVAALLRNLLATHLPAVTACWNIQPRPASIWFAAL